MPMEATASGASTTTITTTTTTDPPLSSEWTHARSRTEPVIKSTPASTPHRRSIDSPRAAAKRALERDVPSALPSPTKSGNTKSKFVPPSIPPRKTHSRIPSNAPKSPTVSKFHTAPDKQASTPTSQSATALPSPTSYFKPQPNSSGSEPRSPGNKRPPASHSSHGIETSTGPPPALSTQRTLSQDKIWKPLIPDATTALPLLKPGSSPDTPTISIIESPTNIDAVLKDSPVKSTARSSQTSEPANESKSSAPEIKRLGSPISTTSKMMDYGSDTYGDDEDPTMRGIEGLAKEDDGKESSNEDKSRSEDLFLNIAKTEPRERETLGKSDRRRQSKVALSAISSSNTRVNTGSYTQQAPSPDRSHFSQDTPPSSQYKQTPASAHPLEDSGRLRYFGVNPSRTSVPVARSRLGRLSRETSPESPQTFDRRLSGNDVITRSYRPTHLARPGSRLVSASEAGFRQDGTESTMSTTAPSTVWDELDDLKSRIRKLELTGKLPSSSAAAMSNATTERPRTATTTVTTISSSPKHGRKNSSSPVESAFPGVPTNVHPNLHEALAKAKPTLSHEVYQKLEASVADALALATIMGSNVAQSSAASTTGVSSSSERVARRKVDNMCRSLTELIIAMTSEQSVAQTVSPPTVRPVSRDASSVHPLVNAAGHEPGLRYQRSMSQEPEDTYRPQTRIQSRLESRRSSILGLNYGNTPRIVSQDVGTAPQTAPVPGTRLNRHSLTSRYRRGLDGAEDEEVAPRPVSRAMTEVGGPGSRYSPRDRASFSREYTSQHPLPETKPSERSPSTVGGSGLPVRRTYLSATGTPTTPTVQPGFRRYAGGQRPSYSSTENTPESTETRSHRYVSGGNFTVQSRVRTSSLSQKLRSSKEEQMQKTAGGGTGEVVG